jgi:hypothetical protein
VHFALEAALIPKAEGMLREIVRMPLNFSRKLLSFDLPFFGIRDARNLVDPVEEVVHAQANTVSP